MYPHWSMFADGTWRRKDEVRLVLHGHETDTDHMWKASRAQPEPEDLLIAAPDVLHAIHEVDEQWPMVG